MRKHYLIIWVAMAILTTLIVVFGCRAGEKEDIQKDLQIIGLTVEKNLYQNEYLKTQAQQLQAKLQGIEAKEKAEADKKVKDGKSEKALAK